MYRNNNVCTIDLKKGCKEWGKAELKDLLKKYIKGAQMVFVIQQKKILLGGISKGDICRLLRNNNSIKVCISELINTNIKRILFVSEKQVFEDAKKIFNNNDRIHNVPVVNNLGELLFQIDRFSKNVFMAHELSVLQNAGENGSIQCFLESDNIKEVILIGSNKEILYKVKQIFYEFCQCLISKNIRITVQDDIENIHTINSDVRIISISEIGYLYINKISGLYYNIITLEELYLFAEFEKIKRFNKEVVGDFIEIFKYKSIGFYSLNKYILFLIDLLNSCNIKCFHIEENNYIGIFDIVLFSGENEEYYENENIIELIQHIELVQKYRSIAGHCLTHDEYINDCINYLYKLQNKGYEGFIQKANSYWKKEFHEKIKENGNLEVIDIWENINFEKKYIYTCKNINNNESLYISTKLFLVYICEHAIYKLIISKCKNVFIFSDMFTNYNICISERNRENYLSNNNFFQNNFTREICNNNENYLTKVIQNRKDCKMIEFNDGYLKFLSNYHSEYFNTDLYGNRIVQYNPNEYLGTIWLVGGCLFNGYAVEDKNTFASFLQEKVNIASYKYRVIDLSCDRGGGA